MRWKMLKLKENTQQIYAIATVAGTAVLLGATIPIVGSLEATSSPQPIEPVLWAEASWGIDPISTMVPSQRLCTTLPEPVVSQAAPESSQLIGSVPLSNLKTAFQVRTPGQFALEPWPDIHPQARLARVPILMYHDVLSQPEVFFDLTPADLAAQLQQLQQNGFTFISLDQLVQHMRTGQPLPEKPVLLSFDDGYAGHYEHVYPLLKRHNAPAVFSVFPAKLNGDVVGRSTLTWAQLQEMAADPLVTVAAHSVTHPLDLRQLSDDQLRTEVRDVKQILENKLGIPIRYFTYPTGYYDDRVAEAVAKAGYLAALTMRNFDEKLASESDSLLTIERMGQSNLAGILDKAWGGPPLGTQAEKTFNFLTPVQLREVILEDIPLSMAVGGHPVTVHADSRYQVAEILERTNAAAAVDGGFFSLEYLDSNVMIGPVLSQSSRQFIPGNASENPRLNGRPLVLMGSQEVRFIPFDAQQHNTLVGIQAEMPGVNDAFVAAAWLVKDGQPQPRSSFGSLFDFDAVRHRAYWGINHAGQPVVGVTKDRVDSVTLGALLAQMGLRDAVMVDSGASTSLAYEDQPLMPYEPRPVPHVIALIEPHQANGVCPLVFQADD